MSRAMLSLLHSVRLGKAAQAPRKQVCMPKLKILPPTAVASEGCRQSDLILRISYNNLQKQAADVFPILKTDQHRKHKLCSTSCLSEFSA